MKEYAQLNSTTNPLHSDPAESLLVVIRSIGERTEQACRKLIIDQGVPAVNIEVVHEAPFSRAMRKSFKLGIDHGKPWTFCVDADLLLRPGAITTMLGHAETQEERVCGVQGYIVDKFFGGPRDGGIHAYRTLLLPLHAFLEPDSSKTVKVLDYGAGWGDFLAVARCTGVDVWGLEYDQRKIQFAQNNGIPCGDHTFVMRNRFYDVFMCSQVLEHLDNPRGALQQLRSLMKPGAVGYIAVPNYTESVLEKELVALKHDQLPSKNFDPLGHLNYFTPESFRRMVFDYEFEEIQYGDSNTNAANQERTSMFARAI